MFQHQIKAVHESAHQEDKQRLDQNEPDRRPRVTTHSPVLLDREGESEIVRVLRKFACLSVAFLFEKTHERKSRSLRRTLNYTM